MNHIMVPSTKPLAPATTNFLLMLTILFFHHAKNDAHHLIILMKQNDEVIAVSSRIPQPSGRTFACLCLILCRSC
jgi:hypothetical protein